MCVAVVQKPSARGHWYMKVSTDDAVLIPTDCCDCFSCHCSIISVNCLCIFYISWLFPCSLASLANWCLCSTATQVDCCPHLFPHRLIVVIVFMLLPPSGLTTWPQYLIVDFLFFFPLVQLFLPLGCVIPFSGSSLFISTNSTMPLSRNQKARD